MKIDRIVALSLGVFLMTASVSFAQDSAAPDAAEEPAPQAAPGSQGSSRAAAAKAMHECLRTARTKFRDTSRKTRELRRIAMQALQASGKWADIRSVNASFAAQEAAARESFKADRAVCRSGGGVDGPSTGTIASGSDAPPAADAAADTAPVTSSGTVAPFTGSDAGMAAGAPLPDSSGQ